jgi:DNA-directed RNA polymerase subunit K/omega
MLPLSAKNKFDPESDDSDFEEAVINAPELASYVGRVTKFEKVRVIGVRATQLAAGAPATIDAAGMTDALTIAAAEFEQQKLPLVIVRTYPNGRVEEICCFRSENSLSNK